MVTRSKIYNQNPDDMAFLAGSVDMVAATRSDTVDEETSRGLYIDSAGNVKFTSANGTDVTLVGLAIGVIHPIQCRRVWDNGTTVTAGNVYLVY